jgi:hypothetical protein
MMVATHLWDVRGTCRRRKPAFGKRACGLRIGFVAPPLENVPGKETAALANEQSRTHVHTSSANMGHPASFPADVSARDFLELGEKLAAAREKEKFS